MPARKTAAATKESTTAPAVKSAKSTRTAATKTNGAVNGVRTETKARETTKSTAVDSAEKSATSKPAANIAVKRGRPVKTDGAAASKTKSKSKETNGVPSLDVNGVDHKENKKASIPVPSATTKVAKKSTKEDASLKEKSVEEKPTASRKRKVAEEPQEPTAKKAKVVKKGPIINPVDVKNQKKLHVYVFGEGSSGELGLGTEKKAIDVKRPRLNANLLADKVGVVKIAAGGMHVLALTHDNKIYSWGVNDQGALGRDTNWEGGLRDMDDDASDTSSDSGSDTGMNPREATPTVIPPECFPEGTTFADIAAGDSMSFALTDDGHVYGWGTFRSNEGILGFTEEVKVQSTPVLLKTIKKVKQIACGANHVLALDKDGHVYAWGSGQQNQLGRRITERNKVEALVPTKVGFHRRKIAHVACGDYHSFAIEAPTAKTPVPRVWAFGANTYAETGILTNVGADNAIISLPEIVEQLEGKNITCIEGGAHHTVAVTATGECLVWGRIDGFQSGIKISDLKEDDIIRGERPKELPEEMEFTGKPKILKVPTQVPGINASFAACGPDHTIAITKDGKAYSWGFSANYQTGQGTDDDVEVATLIDNTAIRDKKLNWAGAGGQYSIVTAVADDVVMTNGVNH